MATKRKKKERETEGWYFIYETKRLAISMLYHKHNKIWRYDYIGKRTSYGHQTHMRNFIDTHAQITRRRAVSGLPFFRRSMLMTCPSSLRHISLGAGKPSALHVKVIFWFSRTATDDCVLLASRMLGGTATIWARVSSGWREFSHVRTF